MRELENDTTYSSAGKSIHVQVDGPRLTADVPCKIELLYYDMPQQASTTLSSVCTTAVFRQKPAKRIFNRPASNPGVTKNPDP